MAQSLQSLIAARGDLTIIALLQENIFLMARVEIMKYKNELYMLEGLSRAMVISHMLNTKVNFFVILQIIVHKIASYQK